MDKKGLGMDFETIFKVILLLILMGFLMFGIFKIIEVITSG